MRITYQTETGVTVSLNERGEFRLDARGLNIDDQVFATTVEEAAEVLNAFGLIVAQANRHQQHQQFAEQGLTPRSLAGALTQAPR